jgi:hypothetical protein
MPNMPDMRNSRIYQYLMGTTPGDYEVQLGETLSGIGQQVGQDWQDIGESNRYATGRGPYAGSFEPSGRLPHEMQAGETLSGVRGQGKTLRSDVENVMRMPRNLLDYIRARFAKQPDLSAGGYDNMNAFEGPAYTGQTAQEWRESRIPPQPWEPGMDPGERLGFGVASSGAGEPQSRMDSIIDWLERKGLAKRQGAGQKKNSSYSRAKDIYENAKY